MQEDIIEKLKQAGLCGRSGSGFLTWRKWQMVKDAKADKKYVICNASEGEPGSFKDKYILENWPELVITGVKIAMQTIGAETAYIYINKDYYQEFKNNLLKIIADSPIELFRRPCGYLCGEETTLLNIIEGKSPEPRIKPPFPTQVGLWNKPTLINNVETFFWVSKIAADEYENNRFYSISGEVPNPGVYELPEDYPVRQILNHTGNLPAARNGEAVAGRENFDFFVQAGGGACGEILLSNELRQPIKGLGAIIVFNKQKTNPLSLMKKWARFFLEQNCDKCTPCREGIYRINEMLKTDKIDKKLFEELFAVLEKTSLCPLGRIAVIPFKSTVEKLF